MGAKHCSIQLLPSDYVSHVLVHMAFSLVACAVKGLCEWEGFSAVVS